VSESTDVVILGLAITSSWGNGHATTYRSLVKGLHQRGLRVLFLERDQPWYADNRDARRSPYCEVQLYWSLDDLRRRLASRIQSAGAVIVGSYVQDGRDVCDWVLENARGVRAFYDIDTPVTLGRLSTDECEYLRADQIPQFDLMLSFTGGPILQQLEQQYGARRAAALYCSVDVDVYRPQPIAQDIDLGYMGTYSADRQPGLEMLLNAPARQLASRNFLVVGAQYPRRLEWPRNVQRIDHLPPAQHARFYSRQRYTLNVTRSDMRRAGHSPSVRLFEAAACGVPIISDEWPGIEEVLAPGSEILIARRADDVIHCLQHLTADDRRRIARAARERVLESHSGAQRASELAQLLGASRRPAEHRSPDHLQSAAPLQQAAASG
jgi:spore maturation protein CgeB